MLAVQRRLPIGAELVPGGVHFRVWAPRKRRVEIVSEGVTASLDPEPDGYFSKLVEWAKAGSRYWFRIDGYSALLPDPASRFQPEGPHGPSQVIDPVHAWRDAGWRGVSIEGQVIYEMHIGTFTPEGTWKAALKHLPDLAEIGITVVELMPVAEFPGTFGWGYDGVDLFAPTRLYGEPGDFRNFVDAAHASGLAVILDVVYNHVGPDGNYLRSFAEDYFTDRYMNEWGEAINFDGPGSGPVREFFVSNARYWIDEFHLDGLRLDATQQIFDHSPEHIVAKVSREARRAAGKRLIILIGENETQHAKLARQPAKGGYGLDALWNDDFHHSAVVAATGRAEAYYSDYAGSPQEFISATKWGFLYQGQYYSWQKRRRGKPALDLKAASFVNFLENHDQVANSPFGGRFHQLTSPGLFKALTALFLLAPGTPLLFQGQEFCSSRPFLYFADHSEQLAELVAEGRREFLEQFPGVRHSKNQFVMGLPNERSTFERCKLDHSERARNAFMLAFHADLLKLRRDDPVFHSQRADTIHGAVLSPEAFVLRFFGGVHGDRLVLVNLGRDVRLNPGAEPLLAPPDDSQWQMLWSSEDSRYGGTSRPPSGKLGIWNISGNAAVVMHEQPSSC